MTEEKKEDRWSRLGITESERQSLMSIYKRLEDDMVPVVVEYKKVKADYNRLYEILQEATTKARGILLASGHTAKQADSLVAAWDRDKVKKGKK